jgi:hypothetical protein
MQYTTTYHDEQKTRYTVEDAEGRRLIIYKDRYGRNPRWNLSPATIYGKDGEGHFVRGLEATLAGDATEQRIARRIEKAFAEWGPAIDKVRAEARAWDEYNDRCGAYREALSRIALPHNVHVERIHGDGFSVVIRLTNAADLEKVLAVLGNP